MFVNDVLDGRVVFVECGGEWGPVASGFGLVLQKVCSGGSCCFFFGFCRVGAGVSAFLESLFECGHGFVGIFRG